jgi:hypothetical protein
MLIAFFVSVSKDTMSMCPNVRAAEMETQFSQNVTAARLQRGKVQKVQGCRHQKKTTKITFGSQGYAKCSHNEPPNSHSFS